MANTVSDIVRRRGPGRTATAAAGAAVPAGSETRAGKGVGNLLPERPDQPAVGGRCVGPKVPDPFSTSFRQERLAKGWQWPIVYWIVLVHAGALAAPWTFTWQGLGAMLLLGWLTGGIGICLGYHRLLTHRSFAVHRPVRWLIAALGGLAGQGSAIHWVANHRKHHALSDQRGDPHSPLDGAWWSHLLWFMPRMSRQEYAEYNRRWAPDMMKDPVLRLLDRTFLLWHIALGTLLYLVGAASGGPALGRSLLVWGMFVRLVYVLHSTWLVNSATHIWGYRSYETTDQSRNLWWVALLTYGEGWHNNHHAHPRMASYGHRWWELDVTYQTIRLLRKLGLAWDVVGDQRRSATGGTPPAARRCIRSRGIVRAEEVNR